tara:strand:- start:1963 stop:2349 length:387 start_codon:yes stop_codon:yes gene_type:complete
MDEFTEIKLDLPKPPSLNKIYAGGHWGKRKKLKDEYKKHCLKALAEFDSFTCDGIELHISYNSRLDIDNGILVSKFLADTLVSEGIIPDDNPKYYKRVTLIFDENLNKNQYICKVYCKNLTYDESEKL